MKAFTRYSQSGRVLRARSLAGLVFGLLLCPLTNAGAESATIAVAANFSDTAEALRRDFERSHPHRLTLVSGATGKLYAQILHGAPFDILLAADDVRPALLVQTGHGLADSLHVYALGRLCLWSPDPRRIGSDAIRALEEAKGKLAIANPELAPYGVAAMETLAALGLADRYRERLVMGENVAQAYAMAATGNAELGFVALSMIRLHDRVDQGSQWLVPADLHSPIRQAGVLLQRAADNAAAVDFMEYLQSPDARALMAGHGYDH